VEEKMPYGAEPASDRAKSPVQLRYVRHNPPRFVQFDSMNSSGSLANIRRDPPRLVAQSS